MGEGAAFLVAEVLALVAFLALVLALWIVVRRTGRLVAETREVDTFRRAVVDLGGRVEGSLSGVSAKIDDVRRHTAAAESIADNLTVALEAVDRYVAEAGRLAGPPPAAEIREAIVAELGRASRALQLAEHGCAILASARGGARELEAQTAVKRGYLNLLHAREAIVRHAARGASLPAPEPPRLFQRRSA